MPSKHERLQKLSATLPVPPLFALGEAELAQLWTNHAAMHAAIDGTIRQIHTTAAAFLDEHIDEIGRKLCPAWAPCADDWLLKALQQAGLRADEAVAVRSSGSGEDSLRQSFAGIFLTRLDVVGLDGIRCAVQEVWASSFGRAAILERVRSGALQQPFSMAVIVQRMVRAKWAGVAFSHDPISGEGACTVEAVAGLGEALVSGQAEGLRARIRDGAIESASVGIPVPLLLEVAALTDRVYAALGRDPVDIEWASDGDQLWLLQARPITTLEGAAPSDRPVLEVAGLYVAPDSEIEPFRPLPEFAQYFRGKRKPLADFARRMGLPEPASLLVRANAAGIASGGERQLLGPLREQQVVLDLSDRVRQQALPRERLLPRLQELLGDAPSVFVIRDFIQGEAGLISQPASVSGQVLCEWSTDGLLAINRGIAVTRSFLVGQDGDAGGRPADDRFAPHHLDTLQRVTLLAQRAFGQAQLEWVLHRQALYLIDFSPLDSLCAADGGEGARVISPGYASGHAMVVSATRDLEQLSIAACVSLTDIPDPEAVGGPIAHIYESMRAHGTPMVIVAPRPYAALAPLVPFAAGFIFEKAATLCHLAILLREQGVPAMESHKLYHDAIRSSGKRLVVNSSALAQAGTTA
jgi:rifampicin phosphotransferase